jgi:hypothetical protein
MIAYDVAMTEVRAPICPTAVEIAAAPNTPWAGSAGVPAQVHIKNTGADIVYLGGVSVTNTTGFPLGAGESIRLELVCDSVYGITNSGELSDVAVLRGA